MKYWFSLIFFWSIFLIKTEITFAQDNKIPIKEYLDKVELAFGVKFSYDDSILSGKYIKSNIYHNNLERNLEKIRKNLSVITKKISERYFYLSKKTFGLSCLVYSCDNGALISKVNAIINNKEGVITHNRGHFQIDNVSKNDSIEISSLGYENKKVRIGDIFKNNLSVCLTKATRLLDEVTVDSNRMPLKVNYGVGYKLKFKKLSKNEGFSDVLESTQLLPGIHNPYENSGELFIRGGAPGQNLILYDGIRLYQSSLFFGAISAFNPYTVNNLNVFKGNTSVEYGNHVSGVVDIHSNNLIPEKLTGVVGADMLKYNSSFSLPISKKIGITFSARKSLGVETLTYKKMFNRIFQNTELSDNIQNQDKGYGTSNVDLSFYDITSKVIFKPTKKDFIKFNVLAFKNDMDFRFKLKDSSNIYTQNKSINSNLGIGLIWERKWNENTELKTTIYSSKHDVSNIGNTNVKVFQDGEISRRNIIQDIGFKSVLEQKLSENSKIINGYEFLHQKVYFESKIYPGKHTNYNNLHSLFFNYGYNHLNDIRVDIGGRVNYNSIFNRVNFCPRLFFQKSLFPNFYLKTGLEFKSQSLTQIIDYSTYYLRLDKYMWFFSENTAEMRSRQYTFGGVFKDNSFLVDIELYKKTVNGISPVSRGILSGALVASSFGNLEVEGLDVFLKKIVTKNYNSTMSYSWGKATYQFGTINNGMRFFTDFDITNNFRWNHNFKYNNVAFSLSWLFNSGLPYTYVSEVDQKSTQIIKAEWNKRRLPNYHRFDFSANYSFAFMKNIKGEVGGSIQNLFNNRTIMKRDNLVEGKEGQWSPTYSDHLMQEITPNFFIKFKF